MTVQQENDLTGLKQLHETVARATLNQTKQKYPKN